MNQNKKIWSITIAAVIGICIIIACYILHSSTIYVEDIESHARSFQNISDEWLAETDIGNEIAALVFYPANSSDSVYTIYLCKERDGTEYTFRAGGKISSVDVGITRFSIEGYDEVAYISLNKQKVSKMTIDDGSNISTLALDSSKPFAIILSSNAGNINFYDLEGKEVKITERNFRS